MKYLKVALLAIIAVCTFASAQAQVHVRIGDRHPRHRRVVVVHHRYHRYHRHHNVVIVRHH